MTVRVSRGLPTPNSLSRKFGFCDNIKYSHNKMLLNLFHSETSSMACRMHEIGPNIIKINIKKGGRRRGIDCLL